MFCLLSAPLSLNLSSGPRSFNNLHACVFSRPPPFPVRVFACVFVRVTAQNVCQLPPPRVLYVCSSRSFSVPFHCGIESCPRISSNLCGDPPFCRKVCAPECVHITNKHTTTATTNRYGSCTRLPANQTTNTFTHRRRRCATAADAAAAAKRQTKVGWNTNIVPIRSDARTKKYTRAPLACGSGASRARAHAEYVPFYKTV